MAKSWDPAYNEFAQILEMCEARGVDSDITKRIKDAVELAEAREAYASRINTEPSEAMAYIQQQTLQYPFKEAFEAGKTKMMLTPSMRSGAFEGLFLQTIISMTNAKRVLEIGTFTGSAALACAEALPEDGSVVTCEFDPFAANLAKNFWSVSPHFKKISVRVGLAQETLLHLVKEEQQFDLVFIDANKDGYLEYFKTVMDKGLLSRRGTIVMDNAFWSGHVYKKDSVDEDGIAIRTCNEYLKSRDDIVQVLVPIRDGAMVIRRKEDVYH